MHANHANSFGIIEPSVAPRLGRARPARRSAAILARRGDDRAQTPGPRVPDRTAGGAQACAGDARVDRVAAGERRVAHEHPGHIGDRVERARRQDADRNAQIAGAGALLGGQRPAGEQKGDGDHLGAGRLNAELTPHRSPISGCASGLPKVACSPYLRPLTTEARETGTMSEARAALGTVSRNGMVLSVYSGAEALVATVFGRQFYYYLFVII